MTHDTIPSGALGHSLSLQLPSRNAAYQQQTGSPSRALATGCQVTSVQ